MAAGVIPPLHDRLRGASARPLMLGPAPEDVYLGEPGDDVDPSSGVVRALRRAAHVIVDVQRRIVETGADLVVAPTTSTSAPALQSTGQAYRAAALTAAAIDLTRDGVLAAGGGASVLGEIAATAGARARHELRLHVERLATAGVDGLLVRLGGPVLEADLEAAQAIIVAAAQHGIGSILEVSAEDADSLTVTAGAAAIVVRGTLPCAASAASNRAASAASSRAASAASNRAASAATRDGAPSIARVLEHLRARFGDLPLGARLTPPDAPAEAQLAIAGAWGTLAPLALSLLGVSGRSGLSALHALVDLTRDRPSPLMVS